jgi:hypothetical protein
MSKSSFIFKDDVYTFKELFQFHTSKKNLYQEGEVVNSETGEVFDISEVYDVREKYYGDLVDIKNTLEEQASSRVVWALTQNQKDRKIKELNAKFKDNSITFDEMDWLLKLENNVRYDERFYIIINKRLGTFYKKYHSFSYPEDMSHADIGKLHLLLDFMTYKNEIRRTTRGNSNHPTTEELMTFMRLTNESSLSKFISKLKKLGIVSEDIRKKDYRTIYINPLFCDRNVKIYPELYKAFKSQLNDVLSDKEVRYLELLEEDMKGGSLTLDTKKI